MKIHSRVFIRMQRFKRRTMPRRHHYKYLSYNASHFLIKNAYTLALFPEVRVYFSVLASFQVLGCHNLVPYDETVETCLCTDLYLVICLLFYNPYVEVSTLHTLSKSPPILNYHVASRFFYAYNRMILFYFGSK